MIVEMKGEKTVPKFLKQLEDISSKCRVRTHWPIAIACILNRLGNMRYNSD